MSNRPGPAARPVLAVDVEPWTVAGLAPRGGPSQPADLGALLDILARGAWRATLFVLAGPDRPEGSLLRRALEEGHEIASHGRSHRGPSELGPKVFREEARASKEDLEQATGSPVLGFRSPNWRLGTDVPWALPTLKDLGYAYDASINPGGPYPGIGSWAGAQAGARGLDETQGQKPFICFVNEGWGFGRLFFPWNLDLLIRALPLSFVRFRLRSSIFPILNLHSWSLCPPAAAAARGGALSRLALLRSGKSLFPRLQSLLGSAGSRTFSASLAGAA